MLRMICSKKSPLFILVLLIFTSCTTEAGILQTAAGNAAVHSNDSASETQKLTVASDEVSTLAETEVHERPPHTTDHTADVIQKSQTEPSDLPAGDRVKGNLSSQDSRKDGSSHNTKRDEKPGNQAAEVMDDDSGLSALIAEFTLDAVNTSLADQTYAADGRDESAVYAINGADLSLETCRILSSGDSSSVDYSSIYGLNAAVLATTGSTIRLLECSVTTSGDGANGVFANGENTLAALEETEIECSGENAHAVMATLGGSIQLTDVDLTTAGSGSAAIAAERESGTIHVIGGRVLTQEENSPGVYSAADVVVEGAAIEAVASQSAVIEGSSTITLVDTKLKSSMEDGSGVMIYRSMPGDAAGEKGILTMSGGKLEYSDENAPLFYVTNTTAIITLKGVTLNGASGLILRASAGDWGEVGDNGGKAILTVDSQKLTGDLAADELSSLTLTLHNQSTWTGVINAENSAAQAGVTLDAASRWILTGDSYVTTLMDEEGVSGGKITNISGNGFTIYYDSEANEYLGAGIYKLSGGGYLKPLE